MDIRKIVSEIESEITRLQEVRSLLAGTLAASPATQKNRSTAPGPTKTGRTLSAEARERMAAAQTARWAKYRKAARKTAREASSTSRGIKNTLKLPAKKSASKKSSAA